MTDPCFLTLDEVLAIHADQIRRYGGRSGIRDLALLQSALGTPETTFEGDYLHTSAFEMAAAYLFHISRNHPFVDGNKRVAFFATDVFLRLNGWRLDVDDERAHAFLTHGLESETCDFVHLLPWIRRHLRKRAPA